MSYFLQLPVSVLLLGVFSTSVQAASEEFNTDFLLDLTDQISVDAVKNGYDISPGDYSFGIFLNNKKVGNKILHFYKNDEQIVTVCIDQDFIETYHIVFTSPEQRVVDKNGCFDINAIKNASLSYDVGKQELKLSVPQINLLKEPNGYVSPKLFNEGINAVIVNYMANTSVAWKEDGQQDQNSSILLNSGMNLGAWRYRNQSVFTKYSEQKANWQTTSNKLERDLIAYKARLEFGDSYTNSDVFDSFNFRGIQLSSDAVQLPSSLQNYAPVIRGMAFTNAVVEIRQNGYLIYSANVAPGQFVIEDLYAANESGDLEISVIESDGRVEKYIQAFSSVPNMVRLGQAKYQMTIGQYRTGSQSHYHPYFGQFSYAYGLSNFYTPYTGGIISKDYYSLAAGLAWSFGTYGSFSLDATYAKNTLSNDEKKDGVSLKFLYAKSLNKLGTSFRLVSYRYSTSGYFSLADAVQEREQYQNGIYAYPIENQANVSNNPNGEENQTVYYSSVFGNKKNQSQISLNQDLGNWGQVYVNLMKVDYWKKTYNTESWQLGYNINRKNINYSIYYQYNKSLFASSNYTVGLSMSLLLDQPKVLKGHSVSSNTTYQYNENTDMSLQTSLSGSFLADKNLNLQMQVSGSNHANKSIGLSSNYHGSKVNSNLSYTYDKNTQQMTAGVSGGVLIHSGGVLFGQQMNSNTILIEAKGAKGVRIENQQGLKIDKSGYAIISSSSAYAKNRIALRAEDLGQNVTIDNAVINDIVPTKMAIVKVKFDVKTGHSVLVNLSYHNKDVMTGSSILDARSRLSVGLVGFNSQAYLNAVEPHQVLIAKWGEDKTQECQFQLPELNARDFGYDEISLICNEVEN